ncbi:MAG TPA: alpha/beta hydrolase fold domain-containing protein [Mycobacterium sp.]|nr:alpha/beta hydrolase fold domain-containing protein [Mycobacterium sp.]
MTLSADDDIEELRAQLAQVNDPSVTPPVAAARSAQAAYGNAVPLPAGIERTSVTLGGVPTERLHPSGTKQRRAFLLLHSGGYSAGTAADHAALAAQLALAADATGYVPEYRRAPEYPFPAALDDAIDAYRGLLQAGIASDKIVVAGDSTGGGMAIAVAQQAAVRGLPKSAGVYAISPWADLTQTSDSYDARGPYDPMLSRTSLQGRADVYLNGADPRSPLASPVFGDFADFPPLLVHVGADEVLLGDAVELARQASLAGSDVTLRVWARMIHIFPWFHTHLQAGRTAITQAGAWMADVMAGHLHPTTIGGANRPLET